MSETQTMPTTRPLGLLCPTCRVALVMSERQNIEIDYCPTCRGVWLDRGELDKIIERSAAESAPAATGPVGNPMQNAYPEPRSHRNEGRSHDGYRSDGHSGGYRRKSWLQEIFD
ncbi:MAG: zf-TFIIB domain-containing protein [Stagnimonas sp.]|nr:zf-TFIIB domain-containing protein [Stagnimonas sp.]